MRGAVVCMMALVFAGCSGGATQRVSFRVVDVRDGDAQPLAGAMVRVIPMEAGLAPLPVTAATLAESAYGAARTVAFSDRDGIVRLDVLGDRAAWIEVERPAVGPGAEGDDEQAQEWRWRWEPASGVLCAVDENAAWTIALEVSEGP